MKPGLVPHYQGNTIHKFWIEASLSVELSTVHTAWTGRHLQWNTIQTAWPGELLCLECYSYSVVCGVTGKVFNILR